MFTLMRNISKLHKPRTLPKPRNVRKQNTHHTPFLNESTKNVYLIDEKETQETCVNGGKVNIYTKRNFTCGELRLEHVGLNVTLCGWLEFQRMNKFLVLRDAYGHTQCLLTEDNKHVQKLLTEIPFESVLQIKGTVVSRPQGMSNAKQPTGDIEVVVDDLTVLNEAKTALPFNIREFQKAKEHLRMKYKYLDLRFADMQRNLRVRSEVTMNMRNFLCYERGFVDVETPTLFKATPGGAQEFIVPTKFPHEFYSLVQSPQQFKQMLMAGSIDRYFQVARCYRDETSRPDRQPEFTQLDIEMSFVDVEGIITLVEDLLQYVWPAFLPPIHKKFLRLSYKDVMENYGTDKPDLRYDFTLQNCTDILTSCEKFADSHCYYLIFKQPYNILTKSLRETLAKNAFPNTNLIQLKVKSEEDFIKKTGKLFTEQISGGFYNKLGLEENDVLFMVTGDKLNCLKRLGKVRVDYVNHLESTGLKIKKDTMALLWVVDFPLFEEGDEPGTLASAHHPFTAPHSDDVHLLHTAPLEVRGQSYDLVLNGNEIAGGSIRIHQSDLQKEVLDMLNIKTDSLNHMLEMLASGCPPHGGVAFGLDRLFATILNTPSIRDVIAFPKTFEGRDPLSGAPSKLSDIEKALYCIKSVDKVE